LHSAVPIEPAERWPSHVTVG